MSGLLMRSTLLSAAFAALMGCLPSAQAQDFSDYNQPAQASQNQNMVPGVRYTTGSVTTSGWEKSLTESNPNLKRWNWSSMTSYTQSCYNKVPAGAFKRKNRPDEVQALRPAGSIYTKPIQISSDTYAKKRIQPGVIVVGDTSSRGNVTGKVHMPKQIAQLAPAAKSYNVNYGVGGTLKASGNEAESIASRQVFGRLVKTQ